MMIVIHHRLTTASKPAAKHAKPSSLKYADTTNRETDKIYIIYIFIFIYSMGKGLGVGTGTTECLGGGMESREHQGSAEREEK